MSTLKLKYLQSELTLDLSDLRTELLIHFDAAGVACTNKDVRSLLDEYCRDVTQNNSRWWSWPNAVEGTAGLPKIFHIALQVAAKRGHVPIVEVLLKLDAIDPNFGDDSTKAAPLHLAAKEGHSAVVELLLAAVNIKPDARDSFYYTPLVYACREGHVSIVQQLLYQNDADCNACGSAPLLEACLTGHKEIIDLLLNKDGIDINLKTLIAATERGHQSRDLWVLSRLLDQKAIDSENMGTALYHATYHNWEQPAYLLLCWQDNINVNITNCDGRTALYWACRRESHGLVCELLERDGIDPNARDHNGDTPLAIACRNRDRLKNISIITKLLSHRDIDPTIVDNNGVSILDHFMNHSRVRDRHLIISDDIRKHHIIELLFRAAGCPSNYFPTVTPPKVYCTTTERPLYAM
ncbi:Ankyrin repeat-containing domain protein [Elaphomyces granulatus]